MPEDEEDSEFSLDPVRLLPSLPPGRRGQFDIVSGLIFLNCTEDRWTKLAERRPSAATSAGDDQRLLETLLHEYFHFLQVVSCGYLYRLAVDLLDIVVRHAGELPGYEAPKPGAAIQRGSWRTVIPDLYVDLAQALKQLQVKHAGITTLSIVEGAAFLFQNRSIARVSSHDEYVQVLNHPHIGVEYKAAYLRATEVAGEGIYETFLSTTSLALCSERPAEAFELLLQHQAGKEGALSAEQVLKSTGYLGTAGEVRAGLDDDHVQNWYESVLKAVVEHEGTPPAFFDMAGADLTSVVPPPICFSDGSVHNVDRVEFAIRAMFASLSLDTLEVFLPQQ